MKNIIILFAAMASLNILTGMKTNPATVNGTYVLTGMREMAGAFRFSSKGQFEFYYTYGAADRIADGSFIQEGNRIILKSSKEPGKDFTVTKQMVSGRGYTVKINFPDAFMASMVSCMVINGNDTSGFEAGNNGIINIDMAQAEKIYLQHRLFPDVVTLIKDGQNTHNYFEVTLNPSLQKISFKGIDLTVDHDTLRMPPNYFMPFENIRFVKTE